MLSDNDKYQLSRMIEKNNVVDKTSQIRELKHSGEIRINVEKLLQLKKEHAELLRTNKQEFEVLAMRDCSFLFYNYMELYNIILKEQMDTTILYQLLTILSKIENGEFDQHEGSVVVGRLLKEIYIDSKMAETKRMDEKYSQPKPEPKQLNWQEFKKNNM